MIFSEPSPDDLSHLIQKYADAKPAEYLSPPDLLRQLIREINPVATALIDHLHNRASDLSDKLQKSAEEFIAADKSGIQARENLPKNNQIIVELDAEVRQIQIEIATVTKSIVPGRSLPELNAIQSKLDILRKRLDLRTAELDFASRKLDKYGEIFDQSLARLDEFKPRLKAIADRIDQTRTPFSRALRWLAVLESLRFLAFGLPVLIALVTTLLFDRFSQQLDLATQNWLPGNYHDAGLLAIFAAQTLIITPLLSQLMEPFWERRFDAAITRLHTLTNELSQANASLDDTTTQISALQASSTSASS